MRDGRGVALAIGVVVLAGGFAEAEPRAMTLDWIFSDEGEAVAKAPEAEWTRDGNVVFLDPRRPKAEQTLERFRPGQGARSSVDARAALASLATLLPAKDLPASLEWPQSLDGSGRWGAYAYGGDLFRLDLDASRFEALTRTEAGEKVPGLSPDGRKLAFVRGNDLWVMDLGNRAESRLTFDGSDTVLNGALSWLYWEEVFDHKDPGYWWSPDSGAIAFLRSDESKVSDISFVDFAPVVPRVIHQRYPKAGGDNPSVRLGIVELDGRTAWLDPGVAYEYIVQVKWLADSSSLGIETLNRAQDRSAVLLVGRGDGSARQVLSQEDPAWVNLTDFHVLRDKERIVFTRASDGHTDLALRKPEPGKPDLLTPLTRGPWSVRGAENWQFSPLAATVDEAHGLVYFTARKDSLVERQLYRVGLDASGLQRISTEAGCHSVVFSPDRARYLDWHSAHDRAPSLSVHDASGATTAVLAPSWSDRLAAFQMSYPEFLTLPAGDGHRLQARLYKPAGFDPKRRYPLILYVYGEPNAPAVTDEWSSWPAGNVLFDQVLLQNGYLVATVDPRSATGETRSAETAVLKHVSGAGEAGDIRDAARWLKAQPWVDPERVGIWGWSGGGTTTLLALTRTEEFKAGIAVAPVTDPRDKDTK
jgi:dipeptidyl-peptidase-4